MLPINVGLVNYLNTKPLLFGLQQLENRGIIKIHYDFPSALYQNFLAQKTQLAILPVATLKYLNNVQIIGSHCIASNDEVASVCIFSQTPIQNCKRLYLDYQSKTSVELAKILCNEFWKINPEFINADSNYLEKIENDEAALIIGDRALQNLDKYEYVYDLAKIWKQHTGLPFVFAVWATQTGLDKDFLNEFEAANALGFKHIDEIALANRVDYYDLKTYYTQNISYQLDDEKRKSIALFLGKIAN